MPNPIKPKAISPVGVKQPVKVKQPSQQEGAKEQCTPEELEEARRQAKMYNHNMNKLRVGLLREKRPTPSPDFQKPPRITRSPEMTIPTEPIKLVPLDALPGDARPPGFIDENLHPIYVPAFVGPEFNQATQVDTDPLLEPELILEDMSSDSQRAVLPHVFAPHQIFYPQQYEGDYVGVKGITFSKSATEGFIGQVFPLPVDLCRWEVINGYNGKLTLAAVDTEIFVARSVIDDSHPLNPGVTLCLAIDSDGELITPREGIERVKSVGFFDCTSQPCFHPDAHRIVFKINIHADTIHAIDRLEASNHSTSPEMRVDKKRYSLSKDGKFFDGFEGESGDVIRFKGIRLGESFNKLILTLPITRSEPRFFVEPDWESLFGRFADVSAFSETVLNPKEMLPEIRERKGRLPIAAVLIDTDDDRVWHAGVLLEHQSLFTDRLRNERIIDRKVGFSNVPRSYMGQFVNRYDGPILLVPEHKDGLLDPAIRVRQYNLITGEAIEKNEKGRCLTEDERRNGVNVNPNEYVTTFTRNVGTGFERVIFQPITRLKF
ncbi:MAG: hypothetical protein ABIE74_03875 [Pseudomonadota bacterium]